MSQQSAERASKQLNQLVKIYCVYLDSFLIDQTGKVIAAANGADQVGSSVVGSEWFNSTIKGSLTVTDAYFCDRLKTNTIYYCSPVLDDEGKVVGVLANAFNWTFALEMLKDGEFGEMTKAYIVNKDASIIAAASYSKIMKDSLIWLRAGELVIEGACGHSVERSRNGESLGIGFSHTKGYNAYKGKGWSAIVAESLGDLDVRVSSSITDNRELCKLSQTGEPISEIESERSGKVLLSTMKEIDDLVYEINTNNREVKLLAVNASIQAGIAGADGEGFSIIANEIAGLAKKSLNFVEKVNNTTLNLREAVNTSSFVRLVDAARDAMTKIDRNLFERYCDVQAFSTFSKFCESVASLKTADAECLMLLNKMHKIYEVYHDIYLVNSKGSLIGSAIDHGIIGHDFSHQEWFSSAMSGNIYVSDIYVSETLKLPVVTFSAPIYGDGKILGVLCTRFNCNFLNDILKATLIDSTTEIYLMNLEGKVIGSRVADDILKKNFSSLGILQSFDSGKSAHVEESDQNNQLFSLGYMFSKGYNTYRGQRWVVIARRPNARANIVQNISPAERFKQIRNGNVKVT